jgi:hypothetical protein
MRVFISWSGARSRAMGEALRRWLPQVIPGIEFFHSEDIPKGREWHGALVAALRDCGIGIFCITPEALRSPWLLFEAGAMAQHGDRPTLLTYLYGVETLTGPLSHFQATRFDRADTLRLAGDLATLLGDGQPDAARAAMDAVWPSFEADVIAGAAVPVPDLLPDFTGLFERKKTFHEPFPECSNTHWDDRLRRTTRTMAALSRPEMAEVFQPDAFLHQGYDALLAALDRYDMHIGAHLLKRADWDALDAKAQLQLEDARTEVLDITATLCRKWPRPILRESPAFETERSADERKSMIHAVEDRIARGNVPIDALRERRPEWALDRIARYLARGAGLLPQVTLEDMIDDLRLEEQNARTRGLVAGLQPLYYVAECIDEAIDAPPDRRTANRLRDAIDEVEHFIEAHEGRDRGEHIRRRVASIREKLTRTAPAEPRESTP